MINLPHPTAVRRATPTGTEAFSFPTGVRMASGHSSSTWEMSTPASSGLSHRNSTNLSLGFGLEPNILLVDNR